MSGAPEPERTKGRLKTLVLFCMSGVVICFALSVISILSRYYSSLARWRGHAAELQFTGLLLLAVELWTVRRLRKSS